MIIKVEGKTAVNLISTYSLLYWDREYYDMFDTNMTLLWGVQTESVFISISKMPLVTWQLVIKLKSVAILSAIKGLVGLNYKIKSLVND